MSGRGDADDATPTALQEEYRQAISAKTREWSSGSSSSSGGEGKKPQEQDAVIKELRAQVEQLRRQQRVENGQGDQGDSTRRESGLEEDWNMEVDEEVDDKKKLDEQRRTLQKQLREIEKFSDMVQMFRDGQKEVEGKATRD